MLAFGLLLVAVTVVVVIRVASPEPAPIGPPEDRPTAGSEVSLPISVAEAIELARLWAIAWNDDPRLILVSSQFEYSADAPAGTSVPELGWVMVSFVAPKEGDAWPRLSVAVSRASGEIYYEEALSSSAEPPAPLETPIIDLPITAEQAFVIAEREIGRSYRDGCDHSRRQAQVALDTTDRDEMAWVVVYYDQRHREDNDIVVRINAHTGELSTDVRGDISCDAGPSSPSVVADKSAVESIHLLI